MKRASITHQTPDRREVRTGERVTVDHWRQSFVFATESLSNVDPERINAAVKRVIQDELGIKMIGDVEESEQTAICVKSKWLRRI